MNTTRNEIKIQETGESLTANFVLGKDEYAFVDDYTTIRIVARVPGTLDVYETLAALGKSTTALFCTAYHTVHALWNGNTNEDSILDYARAITPTWAA